LEASKDSFSEIPVSLVNFDHSCLSKESSFDSFKGLELLEQNDKFERAILGNSFLLQLFLFI